MSETYKAFVTSEIETGVFTSELTNKSKDELPKEGLLIAVKYSSLNYKDALSSIGNKGVTRQFPHTPGIDAAGIVERSDSPDFEVGDAVIVTGYDLGMNTDGGFSEYICVPAHWAIKCPEGLTLAESMQIGTAGLTAAMCIDKLQSQGVLPENGPVLVTGATGGVGTMAVRILSNLGYQVTAVTGKMEAERFLKSLGAKEVILRQTLEEENNRPLLKATYAGAIDTVGGVILANVLKSIAYNGAVAACGLVHSPQLPTTVFPFILRGIGLLGVDSAEASAAWRQKLWHLLATTWKPNIPTDSIKNVPLAQIKPEIDLILQGKQVGRVLVEIH